MEDDGSGSEQPDSKPGSRPARVSKPPARLTIERASRKNRRVVNRDICDCCGEGGTLLCCDTCPTSLHLACALPPLMEVPEGDWFCNECTTKKDAGEPPERPALLRGLLRASTIGQMNPRTFMLPKELLIEAGKIEAAGEKHVQFAEGAPAAPEPGPIASPAPVPVAPPPALGRGGRGIKRREASLQGLAEGGGEEAPVAKRPRGSARGEEREPGEAADGGAASAMDVSGGDEAPGAAEADAEPADGPAPRRAGEPGRAGAGGRAARRSGRRPRPRARAPRRARRGPRRPLGAGPRLDCAGLRRLPGSEEGARGGRPGAPTRAAARAGRARGLSGGPGRAKRRPSGRLLGARGGHSERGAGGGDGQPMTPDEHDFVASVEKLKATVAQHNAGAIDLFGTAWPARRAAPAGALRAAGPPARRGGPAGSGAAAGDAGATRAEHEALAAVTSYSAASAGGATRLEELPPAVRSLFEAASRAATLADANRLLASYPPVRRAAPPRAPLGGEGGRRRRWSGWRGWRAAARGAAGRGRRGPRPRLGGARGPFLMLHHALSLQRLATEFAGNSLEHGARAQAQAQQQEREAREAAPEPAERPERREGPEPEGRERQGRQHLQLPPPPPPPRPARPAPAATPSSRPSRRPSRRPPRPCLEQPRGLRRRGAASLAAPEPEEVAAGRLAGSLSALGTRGPSRAGPWRSTRGNRPPRGPAGMAFQVRREAVVLGRSLPDRNYRVDFDLSTFPAATKVSKKHAVVQYRRESDDFVLINCGKNGTKVDGVLYDAKPAVLSDGACIGICNVQLVFRRLLPLGLHAAPAPPADPHRAASPAPALHSAPVPVA
eukprot:tig00000448_g866.t1